jgi:hypothetical protein
MIEHIFRTTSGSRSRIWEIFVKKTVYAINNKSTRYGNLRSVLATNILESILPNYDFFAFLIFAIKLGHFKVHTIFLMLQTLKLNNKKREKSLFYEEKSLVGLTPVSKYLNHVNLTLALNYLLSLPLFCGSPCFFSLFFVSKFCALRNCMEE